MHTDSHCNASLFSLPGLRRRPRGGGDDPRRSLRSRRALWLWHPEYHPAHPEPHPSHAPPPPHPSTRGDVLSPPQDGRLLPHLLQTECTHTVQRHVPRSVQQLQPEEAEAGGACRKRCCLDVQGQGHCSFIRGKGQKRWSLQVQRLDQTYLRLYTMLYIRDNAHMLRWGAWVCLTFHALESPYSATVWHDCERIMIVMCIMMIQHWGLAKLWDSCAAKHKYLIINYDMTFDHQGFHMTKQQPQTHASNAAGNWNGHSGEEETVQIPPSFRKERWHQC